MLELISNKFVGVGEAMVELAPVGDGIYRRSFAGDTFNTAWHLAQLLGPRVSVAFATRIGADSLSTSFSNELALDGIDTELMERDPNHTMGLYLIELEGAERSFHYWRKNSAACGLADDTNWLDRAFCGAGLVHLSGITVAILSVKSRQNLLDALRKARHNGTRVSFDPNIRSRLWRSKDEIKETIPQFLDVTDIALPSFDDEQANWDDADPSDTLKRFAAANITEVVVKNGSNPVSVFAGGRETSVDTPTITGICDTTGAGDAFNAGYLAARMLGRDPETSIAAGQMLSGHVIQYFGARLPRADVRALCI